MASAPWRPARRAAVLDGLETYRNATVRMFGIPESELAQTLREIGGETDLDPLEITTCLRRAELEVEIRYRPGAEEACERLVEGLVAHHGRFIFSLDGSSIDEQIAELCRGHQVALGRVVHGGTPGRATDGAPRGFEVRRGGRRRVLELRQA